MALPNDPLSWIQFGEQIQGTQTPGSPNGVQNRPLNELLENDQYLETRLPVVVDTVLVNGVTFARTGLSDVPTYTTSVDFGTAHPTWVGRVGAFSGFMDCTDNIADLSRVVCLISGVEASVAWSNRFAAYLFACAPDDTDQGAGHIQVCGTRLLEIPSTLYVAAWAQNGYPGGTVTLTIRLDVVL